MTDDLQGQKFTCAIVAGATLYTHTAEIHVEGRLTMQ